ncbi:MAG TPA: glycosyltransferase family 39 protein [Isosphaeraceae bacterium]|nr:glycosyltransferase family 39 protein [Isosphaeraceae bacterium]
MARCDAQSRSRPRPAPAPPSAAGLPPLAPAGAPGASGAGPWTRSRTALAVAALLSLHLMLAVRSLVRENPTIDEVIHLPAGITYWQTGTFRLYHHNPPLVKLVAALPVLAGAGEATRRLYSSTYWREEPPNKAGFAHEFARQTADRYFELFTQARLLMPLFALVGGLAVFAWSRRLYGVEGGLLSLVLWCFCPNVLAHARLITSDVAATSFGVLATFLFWRHVHDPTWRRAALAGVVLGLAQLTKFSLILLYGLWPLFWLAQLVARPDRPGLGRRLARGLVQGSAMVALSVAIIDLGYGFEGVGIPLGGYEFACRTLTRPVPPGMRRPKGRDQLLNGAYQFRVNRFRDTWLGSLPCPLPRHYLLGFDDQKLEAEGIPRKFLDPGLTGPAGGEILGYPVYLDGVLRQKSRWDYYLRALAYKVPEGTIVLVLLSLAVLASSPRSRASWFDELMVVSVPLVVLVVMSVCTNINLGLRYVLPIFPYLFISTGKLVPWAAGLTRAAARRGASAILGVAIVGTVGAVTAIHPHYLAYFNVVSGGPARGSEHLVDSNLDWGQDLVGLRRWMRDRAAGERIGLAYFGQINPKLFAMRREGDFAWFLPPARPGTMPPLPPRDRLGPRMTRPEPGLYAVSASLLRGLPWRVYDNDAYRWAPREAGAHAFSYFQEFEPIGSIGDSIFLYRLSDADAARLARHWPGVTLGPG